MKTDELVVNFRNLPIQIRTSRSYSDFTIVRHHEYERVMRSTKPPAVEYTSVI